MKIASIVGNCTPIKFQAQSAAPVEQTDVFATQKTASDEFNIAKKNIKDANTLAKRGDLQETDTFVKNDTRKELDKIYQEKKANLSAVNSAIRNSDLQEKTADDNTKDD